MSAVITSVRGLQNLTNLQTFNADWNGLTTIDVSGMTSLTNVDVSDCLLNGVGSKSLTDIDVTGCSNITELRLDDSDFSEKNLASIKGLSNLTSLNHLDLDGCSLSNSIDVSEFSVLDFLDVSSNENLTEVIISRTQPISGLYGSSCNFSQETIDNLLIELSENGISNGSVELVGDASATVSEAVVSAVRTLSTNDWYINLNTYDTSFNVTATYPSQGEACADVGTATFGFTAFVYIGGGIQTGSYVYEDSLLVTPKADGWFGLESDGNVYLVSGSGLIVSQSTCV